MAGIDEILIGMDALEFLQHRGFPALRSEAARQPQEAIDAAQEIGFPVALKISSPDILHKTEVKGVLVDLRDEAEVKEGFERLWTEVISLRPEARIEEVVVQEMGRGREVIIGATHDTQFGPVIMFGLGGIFVEVLQDVSFRVIPIEGKDAQEMIRELRGFPILSGARGGEVNLEAIGALLLRVSSLVNNSPDIREMDLNPVFVNAKGCAISDARIRMKG
ncbi:MAG: acetate--CoA ligase family protein [Deltaproteobacteria bacterium]|nr:acetate--CoA ligase family protein [Deltaproteobacteria bacterium]